MDYEILDCIDAGTEYCPCHLAETGDCILCSQLRGKTFCDCINWKGVCIYQEYVWNGNKAKPERKEYLCQITDRKELDNKVIALSILTSHKMAQDLAHPGSFVFMKSPDSGQFYDAPVSIMDVNLEENIIKTVIEIKGIKTKTIEKLQENEKILIRGPYWNGVLGLKNIYKSKDGVSILICRGIGQAPMVPVLKKLYGNGNKIITIVDKCNYEDIFIREYLNMCNSTIIECNTMDEGKLSLNLKEIIINIAKDEGVNLIHCSGPDILIYNVLNFIEENSDDKLKDVKYSCCNNAKMCCGEGICGTCCTRFKGHVTKKMCKVQVDPKYVFEGRRFL